MQRDFFVHLSWEAYKFAHPQVSFLPRAPMTDKPNTDTILLLDKKIQITECPLEILRLKRTRNSLLNIACIPPEIFSHIFQVSVVMGSYGFLQVCHYWREVACLTSELWNHWGNSLKDWKRSSFHCEPLAEVHLVLMDDENIKDVGFFDENLRNVLRDRAVNDLIREIHLDSPEKELLAPILRSLTPEDGDVRHSSIKSITFRGPLDPSDFFARHNLPQLRDLILDSTDLALVPLKDHTKALVNLSLSDNTTSTPTPTTSGIICLLASNPNIRTLHLTLNGLYDDGSYDIKNSVSLRYLERFNLVGDAPHIYSILSRLEFFGTVIQGRLTLFNCTLKTITQDIGPYLRDYLQRGARLRDVLNVHFTSDSHSISTSVRLANARTAPLEATFYMNPAESITSEQMEQMYIDIVGGLPKEKICSLGTNFLEIGEMPNLESLFLFRAKVSNKFLLPKADGLNPRRKLFPSLRQLYLEDMTVEGNNWDPLVDYLTQTDTRSVTLAVKGTYICPEVVKKIEPLVRVIIFWSSCPARRTYMV